MNLNKFIFFWVVIYLISIFSIYYIFENFEWIVFWSIGFSWQLLFKFPKFIRKALRSKKKFALLTILIKLVFNLKNHKIPIWLIIVSVPFCLSFLLSISFQSDLFFWATPIGGLLVEIICLDNPIKSKLSNKNNL